MKEKTARSYFWHNNFILFPVQRRDNFRFLLEIRNIPIILAIISNYFQSRGDNFRFYSK